MHSTLRKIALTALPLILVSCGDTETASTVTDNVALPQQSYAEQLQTQLIRAQAGDVITIPAGVHEIDRSLSLNVSGVTIRGAGMNESILSFKNQVQGAEGLLVNADDFLIEDLAIEDAVGDALKVNESRNVVIRRVRTEWTNGASSDNGAYGIYPVQSENVLIEGSVAIGASDAGIYVGQSTQIIVRDSRAEYNVAGIEIENSTYADVYDNVATNNTGGILVFDLPNLEVQGGRATRVFNNEIYENNTENFAPPGNIVGNVPAGTGLLILANDNIEAFENNFRDNNSVNIMIYSFTLGGRVIDDPNYDPFPEHIYIHDNNYDGGGIKPAHRFLASWHEQTGKTSPDVVWGGLMREGVINDKLICLGDNPTASFMNLNGGGDAANVSYDIAAHSCTLPSLQPISFSHR